MRFNPPPNWPPPPPGWIPEPGWTPDPSWPPPPPGWQLWVDDSAAARFTSRRAFWAALTVAAAVVLVLGLVFAVGAGRRGTHAGAAKKVSGKPDITQLTRDLLVDKTAFPEFSGGKRSSGLGSGGDKASGLAEPSVNPQECADFYGYPRSATQTAFARVSKLDSGGPRSMAVRLAITPNRPNLKDNVEKCRSSTVSVDIAGRAVTFEARLDPLDAPGVPSWAVGTVMKSSGSPLPGIPLSISTTTATISGYYRGVLIAAGYNEFNRHAEDAAPIGSDEVSDLVRLFNAQVEKLEAAP